MTIRADAHAPEFHRAAPPQLPVLCATTANITISTALNNGDALDGVTLATGNRVLVKDQSTGSQNGIYIVGASPARSFDMGEGVAAWGAVINVIAGTANAATLWRNTNATLPTIDTTALTFAQITSSGMTDPMTTRGDVIIRNASNVTARLGIGANGTYLGSNGTDVSWSTPGGGGGSLTQAFEGYNTVGGSTENWTPGRVLAKKVTLANACLLTSIEAYVDGGVNNNNVDGFMVGVYADSGGTPSELIAIGGWPGTTVLLDNNGATAAGNTTGRWLAAAIGKWLTAADYWIAVGNGDQPNSAALRIYYDGSGTDRYYTPGGTWFADWGNYTPTTTTNKYSIRANTIR